MQSELGVNSSGAIDRASAWAANDVVGNSSTATVLENIGGLELEALVDTAVCITGARAQVSIDRKTFELGAQSYMSRHLGPSFLADGDSDMRSLAFS